MRAVLLSIVLPALLALAALFAFAAPTVFAAGTFVWTAHGVASYQEIHQWNDPTIITSSDGEKLAAVATAGDIYTSTDGGATWMTDTIDYVATDTDGLPATSTRTVIIEPATAATSTAQ